MVHLGIAIVQCQNSAFGQSNTFIWAKAEHRQSVIISLNSAFGLLVSCAAVLRCCSSAAPLLRCCRQAAQHTMMMTDIAILQYMIVSNSTPPCFRSSCGGYVFPCPKFCFVNTSRARLKFALLHPPPRRAGFYKANVEPRGDRRSRGAAAGRGRCQRPGPDQSSGRALRWRNPSDEVDCHGPADDHALHAAVRRGAVDVVVRRGRPAALRTPRLARYAGPPARRVPVRGQRHSLRPTGECAVCRAHEREREHCGEREREHEREHERERGESVSACA